jgi:hypothetical protein
MLFTFVVTVPPNTPWYQPIKQELKLRAGVITKIAILIPAGHQALAHLALKYGETQIIPHGEDQWIEGEDETLEWDEDFELAGEPVSLNASAWNEDDTYPHSFYVRIWVSKEKIAASSSVQEKAAQAMIKLVKRILGE